MTRPRLQLHLSTLLIVSLLAAVLVWMNVRVRSLALEVDDESDIFCIQSIDNDVIFHAWNGRGWPWLFQGWTADAADWSKGAILWNFAVCLALLTTAAIAIGWLTRRMKRKAP